MSEILQVAIIYWENHVEQNIKQQLLNNFLITIFSIVNYSIVGISKSHRFNISINNVDMGIWVVLYEYVIRSGEITTSNI